MSRFSPERLMNCGFDRRRSKNFVSFPRCTGKVLGFFFFYSQQIAELHDISLLPTGQLYHFFLRPIQQLSRGIFCNWLTNFTFFENLQLVSECHDIFILPTGKFCRFFSRPIVKNRGFSPTTVQWIIFFSCNRLNNFTIFSHKWLMYFDFFFQWRID